MSRALFAITCGLAMVMGSAPAAMAGVIEPQIGINYVGNGDTAQCGVNQGTFWAEAPNWTPAIRFDTDGRRGGCELSFSFRDPQFSRVGLLGYRWEAAGPSDPGQCGNAGQYYTPVNPDPNGSFFGPRILVDTDSRFGFCNLTLEVSGSPEYQVDVQFWSDGDSQCFNTAPPGVFRSVRPGSPLTLSIDTDSRPGGCQMSVRLSRI